VSSMPGTPLVVGRGDAPAGGGVDGVAFWTDAALLAGAGIPTVLFGPRGDGAHAEEEWVDLGSLERCAGVYLDLARALCA
jgi:acetylornithine deacetylase